MDKPNIQDGNGKPESPPYTHTDCGPFNPPPKLVTDGPYAFSRNPMLSGIFILLFGLGAAFKSVSLVLIFTPLFILINVMELKSIEEPELEMRLGEEYREYKQWIPMFFPKLKMPRL